MHPALETTHEISVVCAGRETQGSLMCDSTTCKNKNKSTLLSTIFLVLSSEMCAHNKSISFNHFCHLNRTETPLNLIPEPHHHSSEISSLHLLNLRFNDFNRISKHFFLFWYFLVLFMQSSLRISFDSFSLWVLYGAIQTSLELLLNNSVATQVILPLSMSQTTNSVKNEKSLIF